MKRIVFVAMIALVFVACQKAENNNGEPLPPEGNNEIYQIYDFSNIDMSNLGIIGWVEDYENSGYGCVWGYRDANGDGLHDDTDDYLWIGIFDNATKQPVYDYTDYDRPKSYIAYGKESTICYRDTPMPILLDDYMAFVLAYDDMGKSITICDIVVVDKNNKHSRKAIAQSSDDRNRFRAVKWCDNVLFTAVVLDSYYTIEYLYDAASCSMLYEHRVSTYFATDALRNIAFINKFIVSDIDYLDFATWEMTDAKFVINKYIQAEYSSSETYQIFDSVSTGENPDKFTSEILEIDEHSVTMLVTRTTYEGKAEAKTVIISFIGGDIEFSIK